MTRKLLILFTLVLGLSSCAASRFQARAPKTPPADLSAPVFDSIGTQYRPLARFFASQGAALPATGNGFSIYTSGRTMFAAMLRDLENARYSIDFMTYRFADDTIATIVRDVLVRKAREGVSVRVILESRSNPYNPSFYKGFQGVPGLQVIRTQPSHNPFSMIFNLFWRDHRKLAVIDGTIGYLGGMNIQDKYHTEWRDTHSRVTGRVASSYSALFQHAWETFSGPAVTPVQTPPAPAGGDAVMQIVGDGPDSAEPVIRKGLELALSQAKEYFYIQNPYFCPPESTIQALLDAAARGVDVRIMFPKGQDVLIMLWVNHSFYKRLLKGGVRIFERGGDFIHSKTFVADDYLSCIASANLDYRSFDLNFEGNLYVYDTPVALQCRQVFETDMQQCREVTLEDIHWSIPERYLQSFFRVAEIQL